MGLSVFGDARRALATTARNDRGAIVYLPHLKTGVSTHLVRDFRDQHGKAELDNAGNVSWYAYDAAGERVWTDAKMVLDIRMLAGTGMLMPHRATLALTLDPRFKDDGSPKARFDTLSNEFGVTARYPRLNSEVSNKFRRQPGVTVGQGFAPLYNDDPPAKGAKGRGNQAGHAIQGLLHGYMGYYGVGSEAVAAGNLLHEYEIKGSRAWYKQFEEDLDNYQLGNVPAMSAPNPGSRIDLHLTRETQSIGEMVASGEITERDVLAAYLWALGEGP